MWQDIVEVFFSEQTLERKYRYFYDVLHRVCIEKTQGLPADYNDFFSRLQAVCRLTNYPLHKVDTFRWRARQVALHNADCEEHAFLVDVRSFVDAMSHFTDTRVPVALVGRLPDRDELPAPIERLEYSARQKRVRFTVVKVEEPYIYAMSQEMPAEDLFRVDVTMNQHTMQAAQLLREGMQFNALSFTVDNEKVYHPAYIVVEPDFMLDTTTVTGCVKAWGESAFNHLISKLQPSESTRYTLLGDFANQFLDDVLNQPDADYLTSMRKVFADRALDISACNEIDSQFFEETKRQFSNIQQVVEELCSQPYMREREVNIHIEPSFFCEAMGLQGRMDCLIDLDKDGRKLLIELKSGKWDEYRGRAKDEHLMQMLLYKEMLYYNMDVKHADVIGNLLYSKYPKMQEQRTFQDIVFRAMNIRNNIVALELGLMHDEARKWLPKLTPQALRRSTCSDSFWHTWCLPELQKVIDALYTMDDITAEYFYTFLQFIEREQYESKVCDTRPDSTRSLASLWNAGVDVKLENGDILIGVRVVDMRMSDGVDAVCMEKMSDDGVQPNFRIGDSVILYKRDFEGDTAISQQVVRCNVEACDNERVWLKLKYRQRNKEAFSKESFYAIEHDHVDANFRSLYSGIFSLVTCERERRELLLCQRTPTTDDLFLLMGPPGTGKTSVALKRMVEEHLSMGHDVLLLAYTNRAVDEICEMLSTIAPEPEYIRLGRDLACAPQFRQHLLANAVGQLTTRQKVIDRVEQTHVFVSTVASLNSHASIFKLKHFHVAIFDEASQILEPQILGILTSSAIDKFVMIGDHKQLPAVVVQDEEKSAVTSPLLHSIGLTNCRNSLFERLYEQNRNNAEIVAMLDHQGRMHPAISDFVSETFYDSLLQTVGLPHQHEDLQYMNYDEENATEMLVATSRCAFINVPRPLAEERLAKANLLEARMIAQLVKSVVELYSKNNMPFSASKNLGIIVPFRRQIALVRSEIELLCSDIANQLVIDTVERYQGSQRDVIIYGTTITQPYELDILSNVSETSSGIVDRKLNVAITRARKQLFILGNEKLLSRNVLYGKLIDYCRR
ncbi:MAG: ATP-dependent helicase [Prevotellaceae bacterium]|nr:ATP-dependent helicase [Prevotellaceae bacterium]